MLTIYFLAVSVSFIAALACIFLLKKFALRHNLLMPKGIPLVGGVGLALSFIAACILSFFLCAAVPTTFMGIIVASSIMLVAGVLDDWKELSIGIKLIIQIIATAIVILFGVKTQIVHIGAALNAAVTFIFIIAVTNAFNHLDVMDAVAGGVAAITGGSFLVVAFLNKDVTSAIVLLALLGAIMGFLAYNLPPARVYMGNAGSHFLGFVLAAIAINISYAPLEREVALLSPLLILGFAIFDTAFLMLVRIRRKKSPFRKSDDHLVLRFLKAGHSKKEALLSMLALSLFFSASGALLSKVSNYVGAIIIAAVALVATLVTFTMSRVRIDD